MKTVGIFSLITLLLCTCQRAEVEPVEPNTIPPPTRSPTASSDRELKVTLALTPEKLQPRSKTRLEVRLPEVASGARELDRIAGQRMHVVVASRDLLWWKDLHPAEPTRGEFVADLEFPGASDYVVYALMKPGELSHQVAKAHVTVRPDAGLTTEEPRTPAVTLQPSPLERVFGPYRVGLKTEPAEPVAGEWTTLSFHLTKGGEPVTNLEPLDALGHLIVIREGGEDFVYAHSTEGEALGGVRAKLHVPAVPEAITRSDVHSSHGPDVGFHSQFPKPGLYRIWADFTPRGSHVRVDYVVRVR